MGTGVSFRAQFGHSLAHCLEVAIQEILPVEHYESLVGNINQQTRMCFDFGNRKQNESGLEIEASMIQRAKSITYGSNGSTQGPTNQALVVCGLRFTLPLTHFCT